MRNILASVSDMGCFGSLVLSVQDFESYLKIVLIVILILILRFYDRAKDGKLTKQEIKETIDDLQDAKNKIDGMKGGN